NIKLDGYRYNASESSDDVSGITAATDITRFDGRLEFADDSYRGGKPVSETLRSKGVIFCPLHEAIREHEDLVRKHLFERTPDLGSEKFQALHAALFSTGSFVYVPRGVEVDLPLVAAHWTVDNAVSVFPHTLVVAEDNARVTVLD